MNESSPSTPEMRETATAYRIVADLEFPVDLDFNPQPPRLSSTDFIRWCEEMMTLTPINRNNPGESFLEKTGVEFIM